MTKLELKSAEFRREREQSWVELDRLVAKAEKSGIRTLTPEQVLRLPNLYRATLSGLSVARSISLDRNLVNYLESLAVRAYFCVYGPRSGLLKALGEFFGHRFPQAVRQARWHILLATLSLILGIAVGFVLTLGNEDWFYTFVSQDMAAGRTPTASTEKLREVLFDDAHSATGLTTFSSFLFSHNARIGLFAFALGFALGVPVIILLVYTGLMLGAFAALYHSRGLGLELYGWLAVHGTTELLAILLCGGAGLVLGGGLLLPGRYSRLDNLARQGRWAAQIAIGAILLFFVAGLLEGFARQLVTDTGTRYLIGVGVLLWWAAYFLFAGRRRRHGADGRG